MTVYKPAGAFVVKSAFISSTPQAFKLDRSRAETNIPIQRPLEAEGWGGALGEAVRVE